jgi:hypothetical protein
VHRTRCRAASALLIGVIAVTGMAGCSSGSTPPARQAPPARMVRTGATGVLSVLLTPLGAERIGIQTAPSAAAGKLVTVPYQALLYEPDGRTVVYTQTGTYTYTRQFVTVATINGNQVLVSAGLPAGVPVVTVGAEELLGVQNGVGVQT